MFEKDARDWSNHAHWDHSSAPVASWHWRSPWLERWLRRAGLAAHPAEPLALIALGLGHCLMIAALFIGLGGDRAVAVAAIALGAFAMVPGIGLLLTGLWDLTRPLRRRAQAH
jgi:hypothetical protein